MQQKVFKLLDERFDKAMSYMKTFQVDVAQLFKFLPGSQQEKNILKNREKIRSTVDFMVKNKDDYAVATILALHPKLSSLITEKSLIKFTMNKDVSDNYFPKDLFFLHCNQVQQKICKPMGIY